MEEFAFDPNSIIQYGSADNEEDVVKLLIRVMFKALERKERSVL